MVDKEMFLCEIGSECNNVLETFCMSENAFKAIEWFIEYYELDDEYSIAKSDEWEVRNLGF